MNKYFPITVLIIFAISPEITAQYNPLLSSGKIVNKNHSEIYILKEEFQPKSEQTATLLSILVPAATISTGVFIAKQNDRNTDIGVVLASLGIIVGPSTGNVYAENPVSVIKGIGTRLLGSGMTLAGGYLLFLNGFNMALGGENSESMSFSGSLMFYGGIALTLYSTMYDIINASVNVKKYNANKGPFYVLSPVYFAEHQSFGAAISIRF